MMREVMRKLTVNICIFFFVLCIFYARHHHKHFAADSVAEKNKSIRDGSPVQFSFDE